MTGFAWLGMFVSAPEASEFCVELVTTAMAGMPMPMTDIDCVFEVGVSAEQPEAVATPAPMSAGSAEAERGR